MNLYMHVCVVGKHKMVLINSSVMFGQDPSAVIHACHCMPMEQPFYVNPAGRRISIHT